MALFYGKNFTVDGAEFHRTGKNLVCAILSDVREFTELASLVIKADWLELDKGYVPPNTQFFLDMAEEFRRWSDENIPDAKARAALQRLARWLVVLYRMDTNYSGRMGWLAYAVMKYYQQDICPPLHPRILFAEYFKHEKRGDRIARYRQVADYVIHRYDTDIWAKMAWDRAVAYLVCHSQEFKWDAPAPGMPGISYLDPAAWKGQNPDNAWLAVNGGRG
jgi:hypothetical protein